MTVYSVNDTEVCLEIVDNGAGMNPETQQKMFEHLGTLIVLFGTLAERRSQKDLEESIRRLSRQRKSKSQGLDVEGYDWFPILSLSAGAIADRIQNGSSTGCRLPGSLCTLH